MRKFLAYILKNSELVLFIYNAFFKIKNKKTFYKEIEKRSLLSIFDYEQLAQPIPYYPKEKLRDTNYYGYAEAIRQYAGLNNINSALEHGIYLGNRVVPAERYRATHSIITMSQNRVDSLKINGVKKPVLAIGPYIHYAKPFLDEASFSALKNQLGRVLLVMPVHTAKDTKVLYNHQLLLDFINKVKKEYDTVIVCVHFRDIINNINCVHEYESLGYRVVCAGNEYDINFVRRLKTIILLSDYVLSNSNGTNTGFCTYLDRPQTIIFDKDLKKVHHLYSEEVQIIRDEQAHEIESVFSEYCPIITEKQRIIVDKYWGSSLVKEPEELKATIKQLY